MDIDGPRNRPGRHGRHTTTGPEWVGGRVVSPFYITEGTPYRPELILWLELPDLIVVSFQLSKPGEAPASFGAALVQAMKAPMIGRPRRPGTVRVADARLAAEVRQVLPTARIVEEPTPEIHEVVEHMSKAALAGNAGEVDGGEKPSYFENGRVGIEAVEALFCAAKVLYRIAPWKVAGDSQLLRVESPHTASRVLASRSLVHSVKAPACSSFLRLKGSSDFSKELKRHGRPGGRLTWGPRSCP